MAEYKEDNVDDNNNKNKRKRVSQHEDLDGCNSAESKLARVDSVDWEENSAGANVVDADACNSGYSSGVDSPAAKRIEDDLLSSILDESDPDPAIQGLDSVIKSFEEEILFPRELPPVVTSASGEQRPEIGYLFEASDDELGLPPALSAGDEENAGETVDLNEIEPEPFFPCDNIGLTFDDGMLSYDPLKFGTGGDSDNNEFSHDFITLGGGLFDSFEPAEISEHSWRQESLSAS
ncbi:uncharacterized protein LOC123204321 [Mangifera indica]|uniref:uncharacterized protein LOC123204321 n=1 Tax=Mangifera indica TaxID=29780 RepID=UPI001CF9B9C2|nr:uncharacterized protein LOC123204321 [Mangifera indica]